jgi:hypothetical protein
LEAFLEDNSCLLSGGAPESPVHHRTSTVHCPVRISFLKWHSRPLLNCSHWRTGHCPVHTGQSGAPSRPLAGATRRVRIARPIVALAAVGSPDSPMHPLSAFRDRGVLGPTSEMSPRAPAQMGRRETEREGGKKAAGARQRERERGRGGNPVAFVFVPRPGRVRLQ